MRLLFEFYQTNRPHWERLEKALQRAKVHGLRALSPDDLRELGRLYRKTTSNLAYARTHQLDPELVHYLNNLVGRAHAQIYVPPANTARRIGQFFRHTFPMVLQKRLAYVVLAALLMAGSAGFGLGLQLLSPKAAERLVPAGTASELYERFTKNAWFNNPLAERPVISAAIMANNIRVAVTSFAGGILLGLLTFFSLYQNGLMLGIFTGFFIQHRHGLDFWATILPHGVTELTAISIAAGAGLLLAGALINPGPYRRRDALVQRGREAVILFLGVVVLLVVAGAIEGFVSTIGTLGNLPRLGIAAVTAVLLGLYLFYPRRRDALPAKDGLTALVSDESLP